MIDSARAITAGEGDLYIAGGVESMSRAPFVMGKAESAYSRDAKIYDTTIGTRFPNHKFTEQFGSFLSTSFKTVFLFFIIDLFVDADEYFLNHHLLY